MIPQRIRILLDDDDRRRARAFFAAIKASKPNVRRCDFADAEERERNEIAGKLAEVCVGAYLELPVNWTVGPGSDGHADFTLDDGRTIDVKAIAVQRNLEYDFQLVVGEGELRTTLLVLVLIPVSFAFGEIAGAITAARFRAEAHRQEGWKHRGVAIPLVLPCSQLDGFDEVL